MESFSLEDDDLGLFITQTLSVIEENTNRFLEDSFDFDSNEVGKMHYLDISEEMDVTETPSMWVYIMLIHLYC